MKIELRVVKNLEYLIAKAKTNPYALEKETGVKQPTIHRILTGESTDPRTSTLQPLADFFGVTVSDLRHSDLSGGEVIKPPPIGYFNAEAARTTGKLPLISWVQAGEWSAIVDNFQPGNAEDWIPCPFSHGENAFILRVAGSSMHNPGGDKSYAPGEFIAVDPNREAANKNMVVVRIDQEDTATFKQLLIEPDGTYLLQALNPNWPNRIMAMPKDAKIVGVVIGKWVPE